MNEAILALHAAIAAVAPIDGVSIGRWGERETWRIDFRAEATDEQRYAAAQIADAFDPQAADLPEVEPAITTRVVAALAKVGLDLNELKAALAS
jgi:hypothetical protein